jgi:cyclomaltodextrinase / maltogenic alpha-amylase / neopullulanase
MANEAIAFRAVAEDAEIAVLLNVGDDPFRFPVSTDGLTVAVTPDPDPGTHSGDPALVPAHSWAILA